MPVFKRFGFGTEVYPNLVPRRRSFRLYGHHHTGLGALLLAITALFTRIVRFLVHHPHADHVPGLDDLHDLLHRLTRRFPAFRDFAEHLLQILRQLRRR